jgi:ABC-type cobalt transport system substrate-binding protein
MKRWLLLFAASLVLASPALAEEKPEKWAGIDEAVIEKYAEERGREAAEPLIPVEGDLLLFLFTVAGIAGGFIMGYYWHKVFVVGRGDQD